MRQPEAQRCGPRRPGLGPGGLSLRIFHLTKYKTIRSRNRRVAELIIRPGGISLERQFDPVFPGAFAPAACPQTFQYVECRHTLNRAPRFLRFVRAVTMPYG